MREVERKGTVRVAEGRSFVFSVLCPNTLVFTRVRNAALQLHGNVCSLILSPWPNSAGQELQNNKLPCELSPTS